MGNARLGVTLGVALAALVGCSDDDSPPVIVDMDAGVDGGTSEGPVDPTSGGDESSTTTPTEATSSPDTLTVGATGTSEPGTDGTEPASTWPGTETLDTSVSTVDQTSSAAASSQPTVDTSSAGTSDVGFTSVPPSTDDTGGGDAIDPPDDMIVIANFDATQGFQDGQHDLDGGTTTRTYANSLMTLEIPFTATGQQTGVNFNYTGGICGYDLVARARMRSGTIASGGVQLRFWSDGWGQFASRLTAVSTTNVGEWIDYRATWSEVAANNPNLNIDQLVGVGVAFLTFGNAADSVFDVDYIGLVPSDTPCPSVDTGDTEGTTTVTPDVDSGVVDTTVPDGGTGEELPNLVANGGFEVDTAGWDSWDNAVTLTASTDKARTGEQSMLVSGGTDIGPARTIIDNPMPGGTYEITFWASTAADPAQVRVVANLACLDNAYPWIVNPTEVTSVGWTELTGTLTVPEDCDSTSFAVYIEGDTAGADVYLDDVSVTLVSVPEEPVEAGVSTAPELDSGVAETSEPMVTSDEADTTAMVDSSDASAGDSTATDGVDAAITEGLTSLDVDAGAPVDTSAPIETSAPADTTVGDVTSAPDPYGPNIHTNPGFESGTDWWYLTGSGSIERSMNFAHSGTYSLLNTGRTATWNGAGTSLLSNGFVTTPVVMGATYLIEAWVRLEGLASATVALSGTFICDGVQTTPWLANGTANDADWTLVSGEFTVPTCAGDGLTTATLIVNNPGTAASIYLDDFSVRQVLD